MVARRPLCCRAVVALVVLLVALACDQPPPPPPPAAATLLPLPAIDLEAADSAVRAQIMGERDRLQALADDPSTPAAALATAYGDLALVFLAYELFAAADPALQNAHQLAPGDGRWPHLLGYLRLRFGDLPAAVTYLERSLASEPDDLASLIRLARARVQEGDHAAARALFQRALDLDASCAAAHAGRGEIAALEGDAEAAVGHYERALVLQPEATSLRHSLGLAYRRLGDLEAARRHLEGGGGAVVRFADPLLQQVEELGQGAHFFRTYGTLAFDQGRFDKAARLYAQALAQHPGDLLAAIRLGVCLDQLGGAAEAVQVLSRASGVEEVRDAVEETAHRAEIHRLLGLLHARAGREAAAIESFQRALHFDPHLVTCYTGLADALARSDRFTAAVAEYDRALGVAAAAARAEILVKRATALVNLGRGAEALVDYEQALELAPEDGSIRLRHADALAYLGRPAAAARARDPSHFTTPHARALRAADEAARHLADGQRALALDAWQAALAFDPSLLEARQQRARILAASGQLEAAAEELAQLLQRAPRNRQAHRELAAMLLAAERWPQAASRLETAVRLLPRDRGLRLALAHLLAAAPDPSVRNGSRALALSRPHCRPSGPPAACEILAAAHAEAGQHAAAADLLQRLLAAAPEGPVADRYRRQRAAYERGEPWRADGPQGLIALLRGSA